VKVQGSHVLLMPVKTLDGLERKSMCFAATSILVEDCKGSFNNTYTFLSWSQETTRLGARAVLLGG